VTLVEYGSNPVYDPPSSSDKAYYPCVLYDKNGSPATARPTITRCGTRCQGQFEAVTYSDDG